MLSCVSGPASARGQNLPADTSGGPGHWFYDNRPFGSESLVHPLRLILNGGFGTLQFQHGSNQLGRVDLRHGWRRLCLDMGSPLGTIRRNGWNEFLGTEVVPVSVNRKGAQYWPNYTLHLVGGGMSSVMMCEWFQQHGWRHPKAWAGLTITSYHVLNEVVEASERHGASTDAIADLLLFDPAGVWLFSHPGVDGFFSRRLHLRDWSCLPSVDPATGAVYDNGQNFSIRCALPRTTHWSLFYYFGNHGEAGVSYRFRNGTALSVGGGMSAAELQDLGRGVQTARLVPSGGLFFDREGSLIASVTTAKTSRDAFRLNVYPGLLGVGKRTAGVFILQQRHGATIFGLHLVDSPLGIAGRR